MQGMLLYITRVNHNALIVIQYNNFSCEFWLIGKCYIWFFMKGRDVVNCHCITCKLTVHTLACIQLIF